MHYSLKIKTIMHKKLKEIQQRLIESILNNKFEDSYKDKIIEFNSMSSSVINGPFHSETNFSTFLINKPKIYNHYNSKLLRQFSKEDPTPTFCALEKKETKKSKFHNSSKIVETKRENIDDDNKSPKRSNKSSCSLISMSSILVNNCAENNTQKKNENEQRSNKRIKHNTISEKKNNIHKMGSIATKKPLLSEKFLEDNCITRRKTSKTVKVKSINHNSTNNIANNNTNNGNKELFVELLKFANEIYKENYINEKQKKNLKQLIINYIAEKHQKKY